MPILDALIRCWPLNLSVFMANDSWASFSQAFFFYLMLLTIHILVPELFVEQHKPMPLHLWAEMHSTVLKLTT